MALQESMSQRPGGSATRGGVIRRVVITRTFRRGCWILDSFPFPRLEAGLCRRLYVIWLPFVCCVALVLALYERDGVGGAFGKKS